MATSEDGTSVATISIVDLFAPQFDNVSGTFVQTETVLLASAEDMVTTNIGGNGLGVDNPSVEDNDFFPVDGNGAGIENRDFNDGEGLVFKFDVPVIVTQIDFGSLDDGTVTIDIEDVGTFDFVANGADSPFDLFSIPFGTDFIPADANITISFSSPDVPDATVRLAELRVSTSAIAIQGDFNQDGMVDCADLDGYVNNIGDAAIGDLAALDIDVDGTLTEDDANTHITTLVVTSNGVMGTFPGDLNCDGSVSVLGDAFALVANLGDVATMYSQGDINFSGDVSVLGDAFILVANLGMSNE
ncbi:hypothetical protein N9L06_06825, partial [Mariniblastus sp.]|nr:hypothetical protein [Mariniblastus sp.]